MNINVFLLCYNEQVLLPHTIKHYKKYLPSCKITIYDNESTDNSVEIAKSFGCSVVSWNSNNMINDYKYQEIKNTSWKGVETGWIIMADMDEFLCVTEEELLEEFNNGTTILQIDGFEMAGESQTQELTDIDLQDIKKGFYNWMESKYLCFLREHITEMNYNLGAHMINPVGQIKYSSKKYQNKHMNYLGLNFIINKIVERYNRSQKMRYENIAVHYTNDIERIRGEYTWLLENASLLT